MVIKYSLDKSITYTPNILSNLEGIFWRRYSLLYIVCFSYSFLKINEFYSRYRDRVLDYQQVFVLTVIVLIPFILHFIEKCFRRIRQKRRPYLIPKVDIIFTDLIVINDVEKNDFCQSIALITIFEDRLLLVRNYNPYFLVKPPILDTLHKDYFENGTMEGCVAYFLEKNPKIKVDYYKPLWKRMLFLK